MEVCPSALVFALILLHGAAAQSEGHFWWLKEPGALDEELPKRDIGTDVASPEYEQPGNELSNEVPNPGFESSPDGPASIDGPIDGSEACYCIEYDMCGEDGVIITSGDSVFNIRLSSPAMDSVDCPGSQLCCRLPPETDEENPAVVPFLDQVPPKFPEDPLPEQMRPNFPDVPLLEQMPPNFPDVPLPEQMTPMIPDGLLPEQMPPKFPDVEEPQPSDKFVPGLCGTSHVTDSENIDEAFLRVLDVDGKSETAFGEFPWMLVLLTKGVAATDGGRTNVTFKCGASLIQPGVALTAAHCVHGLNTGELSIRAGEWDVTGMTERIGHQDSDVDEVIIHPEFKRKSLSNDVALLILNRPFTLMDNVDFICLPEQDEVFDGSRCVATGWGKDALGENASFPKEMKRIDLPIVPSDDCQKSLRTTKLKRHFRLHNSFICAGGEQGKDTCQGDGGGPLVCPIPSDPNRFVQVGIVAWGIECGQSQIPAVYANVAKFRDWIDQTLQKFYYR